MKRLYDLRSKAVHGEPLPQEQLVSATNDHEERGLAQQPVRVEHASGSLPRQRIEQAPARGPYHGTPAFRVSAGMGRIQIGEALSVRIGHGAGHLTSRWTAGRACPAGIDLAVEPADERTGPR